MKNADWNRILRIQRIVAVVLILGCSVMLFLTWHSNLKIQFLANAALLIFNISLGYVQWFVFKYR